MSSGDDWTHHWILTNMSPSNHELHKDKTIDGNGAYINNYPIEDTQVSDEGISTSPVNSIDLDRDSPMACSLDDEEDDVGSPSIEMQVPELVDNSEISRITSSWINSGGHYGASLHPGLGYESSNSIYLSQGLDANDDQEIIPMTSGLGGGDHSNEEFLPVFGPSLPMGPCSSPVQENIPLMYGDVVDDGAASGLCGLRNLGNTCFMAAGIQCLVNTPPIAQYFFKHHLDTIEDKDTLAGRFSQLTHKMWSGKYSSLRPAEFKEAFGQYWRDFRDYRQHDCQEFMTLLLEALRKQMPIDESDDDASHQQEQYSSVQKSCNRQCEISNSPSPPCSISPNSIKQQLDIKCDIQEDIVGLDSGAASPKSSISSTSVDAHLISLRLQPIPEEVKNLNKVIKINSSTDIVSEKISCQTMDNITSIPSEMIEEVAAPIVRRYNQLSATATHSASEATQEVNDGLCDSSTRDQKLLNLSPYLNSFQKNFLMIATGSAVVVNFEDIMKETKTSNVNVLAQDNVPNNELLYDSEKYARLDVKNLWDSVDNLNRPRFKRVKEVNLLVDKMDNSQINSSGVHKQLGCSSINIELESSGVNKQIESSGVNKQMESSGVNKQMESSGVNKQMESSGVNKQIGSVGRNSMIMKRSMEKNIVEFERNDLSDSSFSETPATTSPQIPITDEQRLAEECWKSFINEGKSAIVDTFYGQFKSSLVCSVCGHTSVKFDPFGTLSVPLPHANEIQIAVTYVPHVTSTPTRCLLTLLKVSTVLDLKNAFSKLFGPTDNTVVITEVFDNHIARTVEESYLLKFLNYNTRNIYAFELVSPPQSQDKETQNDENEKIGTILPEHTIDESTSSCNTEATVSVHHAGSDSQWQPCNICLEELCQTDLRTHGGCIDCVLCENCIEMSSKHHGGASIPCPVCQTLLAPDSFIPVAKRKTDKSKARILRVPVVFRIDTESDDNNKREMVLIGHPSLLSLPSRIKTATLRAIIDAKLIPGTKYTLLFVDGRGYNCSRCLFASHCRGCDALKKGSEVSLRAGDTLCVRFTSISSEQKQQLGNIVEHSSLLYMRQTKPLTLYDCLRAFTQSETLEENDSWFCPKCERKQQATKTISVWKYPPYLIIHLERFLFHGAISTKLDDRVLFPLNGLDLSDFVSGDQTSPLLYNLYSSVCHMGVAQAGHYTALVRSPVTNEWHYFNDDSVTRQKLKDDEYSTSYLLFYHRQGTEFDLALPPNFAFIECLLPKDDSANNCDDVDLEGCRKRVCLQIEEGDRKAIATSFSIGEERQRKGSSKASDCSFNSDLHKVASTAACSIVPDSAHCDNASMTTDDFQISSMD